jgi:hypothetical protein
MDIGELIHMLRGWEHEPLVMRLEVRKLVERAVADASHCKTAMFDRLVWIAARDLDGLDNCKREINVALDEVRHGVIRVLRPQ